MFAAVGESVAGDVPDVVVGERVHGLLASARAGNEAKVPQHPEVLRHERLRRSEVLDELVHAARSVIELQHDRKSMRRPERPQQFSGSAHHGVVARPIKTSALTHYEPREKRWRSAPGNPARCRDCSVLIPVTVVRGMAVTIVVVVVVITMADRLVTTFRPMDVIVLTVRHVHIGRALVPVVVVLAIRVAVVQVVGVPLVFDRNVATACTVTVLMRLVESVFGLHRHRAVSSLPWRLRAPNIR